MTEKQKQFVETVVDRNKSQWVRLRGQEMPQKEVEIIRKQAEYAAKIIIKS